MKPQVAIIMGSDSDLPVMSGAQEIFNFFKVPYEIKIVSAHRTPKFMVQYAADVQRRGIKVIIAGAGGAAHLPGMVASVTPLPVIGVPIEVGKLKGIDALFSIVQMPRGVPVGTMGIDNSQNAALYALRIIAVNDRKLLKKIKNYMKAQIQKVSKSNKKLALTRNLAQNKMMKYDLDPGSNSKK